MNALIPIASALVGSVSVPTVNARELHAFLEVQTKFADWIKDRIEQYGFVENQDYVLISEKSETKGRGGDRRSIGCHLTLDMAKELSMVERNARGKQARQYFIECERRAKQAPFAPLIPQTLPDALRLAAELADQKQALETRLAEQAPKVQGFDRLANAEGLLTLRETATTLKVPEKQLIQWLQQHQWLYRRPGKGVLLGYAERIRQGVVEHKAITIHNDRTGVDEVREHVRITPRGLSLLAQRLNAAQVV